MLRSLLKYLHGIALSYMSTGTRDSFDISPVTRMFAPGTMIRWSWTGDEALCGRAVTEQNFAILTTAAQEEKGCLVLLSQCVYSTARNYSMPVEPTSVGGNDTACVRT